MACSKRQCGFVSLGLGIFFLIIGILCGFLIPKLVVEIIAEKSCVDSEDDPDYKDWIKEKPGTVTKIYYWVIKNKNGFLYEGKTPELEQRGPYVYKQKSQKINVTFNNTIRTHQAWKKEGKFSKADSCSNCSEDDILTVLNVGYVGAMAKFGGDLKFALLNLPGTVGELLEQFNNSYKQLGVLNESTWQNQSNSGWKNPGFGAWLRENYPGMVNDSFTEVEMKGLYDVLSNPVILFGSQLTNTTVKANCEGKPHNLNCGFIAHMEALKKNSTVFALIRDALCTNVNVSCFDISTRQAFAPLIFQYILHVSQYTMWRLLHEQDDIVTTISQRKLALGYSMKLVLDPQTRKQAKVPGLVTGYDKKDDAMKNAKTESFYTCKADKSKRNQWKAYGGHTLIPPDIFNLTKKDQTIDGYSMLVPRSETSSKPCSFSHELPKKSFDVFVGVLYKKFTVTLKEDISLYGLKLKRYALTKKDYWGHSAVHQGLMDDSKLRGIPAITSLPHFLYATNLTIPKSFNQQPDEKKHQSTYDVEPVTGGVFRAYLRVQLNVPIGEDYISVARIKPMNISYRNTKDNQRVIPYMWLEVGGEGTEEDAKTIKKKVIGLLGISCGVLIALSVISLIFIVVFIALLVISLKANQITQIN